MISRVALLLIHLLFWSIDWGTVTIVFGFVTESLPHWRRNIAYDVLHTFYVTVRASYPTNLCFRFPRTQAWNERNGFLGSVIKQHGDQFTRNFLETRCNVIHAHAQKMSADGVARFYSSFRSTVRIFGNSIVDESGCLRYLRTQKRPI